MGRSVEEKGFENDEPSSPRYRVGRVAGDGVRPVRRGDLHGGDEVVLRAGDHVPGLATVVAGRASVRLYSRTGTTPAETVEKGAVLPAQTEVISGSLVITLQRSATDTHGDTQSQTEPRMQGTTEETRHERSALRLAATMVASAFGVAAMALLGAGSVVPVGIAGLCCGAMALGRNG